MKIEATKSPSSNHSDRDIGCSALLIARMCLFEPGMPGSCRSQQMVDGSNIANPGNVQPVSKLHPIELRARLNIRRHAFLPTGTPAKHTGVLGARDCGKPERFEKLTNRDASAQIDVGPARRGIGLPKKVERFVH